MRPILRVGLTGGIASGKTTVAAVFAGHGAFLIDADQVAHDLMRPGAAAFDDVVARFGPAILGPDGAIDRSVLGRIVFHDADARRALDSIVHPRILPEIERRIAAYLAGGHAAVAVVDAALLVETGIYLQLDRLVVTRCSRETQIRRLMTRNALSAAEASARIDAQAPLADKLAVADYVIDTDDTLRRTREEAERVWRSLMEDYQTMFGDEARRPEREP